MLADRIARAWYRGAGWLYLLKPLSWLYCAVARRRRRRFLKEGDGLWRPPVPVVVVGNITVGGTGKSPLVAALADWLRARGLNPGIVSRGYGGQAVRYPLLVDPRVTPDEAGDEPVMLARRCGCPVVVDPDRARGVAHLLSIASCDVVLSDDGLQHYRLWRDYEIAVIDGVRGLGNGWCLPAGPLREPVERLETVDAIVYNGGSPSAAGPGRWEMHLRPLSIERLIDGSMCDLVAFAGQSVHGVAGIGNPPRFFETLRQLGMDVIEHAFVDHHRYNPQDLAFDDAAPILMTEKDAVKCRAFATERMYFLKVGAQLDDGFFKGIGKKLGL